MVITNSSILVEYNYTTDDVQIVLCSGFNSVCDSIFIVCSKYIYLPRVVMACQNEQFKQKSYNSKPEMKEKNLFTFDYGI